MKVSESNYRSRRIWISTMFENSLTLKVLVSAFLVVGIICYFESSTFEHLYGETKPLKITVYVMMSVGGLIIICGVFYVEKLQVLRAGQRWLVAFVVSLVLMVTSLYSFYYDKKVAQKLDILIAISNGAFAFMSLGLSNLIHAEFESGLSNYFLGCFTTHLMIINLWLIIPSAVVCYIVTLLRSHSHSGVPWVNHDVESGGELTREAHPQESEETYNTGTSDRYEMPEVIVSKGAESGTDGTELSRRRMKPPQGTGREEMIELLEAPRGVLPPKPVPKPPEKPREPPKPPEKPREPPKPTEKPREPPKPREYEEMIELLEAPRGVLPPKPVLKPREPLKPPEKPREPPKPPEKPHEPPKPTEKPREPPKPRKYEEMIELLEAPHGVLPPKPVPKPREPPEKPLEPTKPPEKPREPSKPPEKPREPPKPIEKPCESPKPPENPREPPKPRKYEEMIELLEASRGVLPPKSVPKPREPLKPPEKPCEPPKPSEKPHEPPKPTEKPRESPKPPENPREPPKPHEYEEMIKLLEAPHGVLPPKSVPKPREPPEKPREPLEKPHEPPEKPREPPKPIEKPRESPKPPENPREPPKPRGYEEMIELLEAPHGVLPPKPVPKPREPPKPIEKPCEPPKPPEKPCEPPKPPEKPREPPKPREYEAPLKPKSS